MSGQQQETAGVRVDSIVVRGNVRVATPVILSDLGVRPGDVVTSRHIQRGLQRLYGTGQYLDVRVFAVGTEPATLVVEVIEQPFIAGIAFQGSQHVDGGAIRDTAGLEANAALDYSAVYSAIYHIRAQLSKKGYVRAAIDTTLVPTNRPGEYRLVFDVRSGRRLVVAAVEFEGNSAFSDYDIVGAMTSRPEGFWWWQTGEFREGQLEEDLEVNLVEFYGKNGYLDFHVIGDSMIVDEQTGKTKLIILVDEGRQYRIGSFSVEGNSWYPTAVLQLRFNPSSRSLLSRMPLIGSAPQVGDPVFDTHVWAEATEEVRQMYRNSGYLYAEVEPIVERLPDGDDGNPRVGLKWRITENEQAYVELVNIIGNTTTHERIIRERLVLLPGDVYGDERIVNSYQTIQGLGFFEPLPPNEALGVRPDDDGNINVTFKVQERQTGNINFGASLSPAAGAAGFIGYEQPNLFGQAKQGRFRWVFGTRTNDIEVSYTDPSIFGSRKSVGVALRNSRDQGSFVGLGRRRQVGGSLVVGAPFFDARWTRVSVRYSLFRDEYDSNEDLLDLAQRQLLNVGTRSSIEFAIVRDTRNHPLFPSRGSRNSASLEFVGGALGGDGEYRKIAFESSWFTPVAQLRSDPTKTGIDLSVGLSLQGGAILGRNPFFLERFYMGGVQYGPPLRGYDELTVTPEGHVPTGTPGFNQLDRVGESWFGMYGHIGMNLGGNIFVNAFYDSGAVWNSAIALDPTTLLRGAGFGVSVITPVGPLGLDYAYGFDRRDIFGRPNPGWKLHFRFGQVF
jgi:outer membrane protein insertion porin family